MTLFLFLFFIFKLSSIFSLFSKLLDIHLHGHSYYIKNLFNYYFIVDSNSKLKQINNLRMSIKVTNEIFDLFYVLCFCNFCSIVYMLNLCTKVDLIIVHQ